MCSTRVAESIRVGVLTDEPIRRAGLASIFEDLTGNGSAILSPMFGTLDELMADRALLFLVVDLNSFSSGVRVVEAIRRRRPDMRLVVIGPEGNDKLVMDLIVAGARAYLDPKASPQTVRQAIEVVTSGSIWAPRRLLSKLVDRLLGLSDTALTNSPLQLTEREGQVLELILKAHSNREIARQLGIEEGTVKGHVGRLMRKTGADNRTDLFIRASSGPLASGGHYDRRAGDRRQGDRRKGSPEDRDPFTN